MCSLESAQKDSCVADLKDSLCDLTTDPIIESTSIALHDHKRDKEEKK